MSKIVQDFIPIKIEPSDNLFKELGNNTYNFVDLISEFIDNSIAAKLNGEVLNINIIIGLSKEDETLSYLRIKDNASGIKRELLGKALSPGGTSGGRTLNEHGLGMKQAIAALGNLEYLITKTTQDDKAIKIKELKFGDIKAELIPSDFVHGTEIKVVNINSIVPINHQKYRQSIVGLLGARYRRFLREDNKKMNLSIKMINVDKKKIEAEWDINGIEQTYFHSSLRKNEPMIDKEIISGRGWKAKLTFGYAPSDKQYEELGLEVPKNYMPYHVSINKQGLDIINNDRVIKFHQLSEIGLVSNRYNKYNYIRGEIDLITGFTTAITKNNVIIDKNFNELILKVKEILAKKRYLEKITYPEEITERLLRDRLKNFLCNNTFFQRSKVEIEYQLEHLDGVIDILADGEPWEVRVGVGDGLAVYQLFAYMDMGNFKNGYLVAKSFTTGAYLSVEHIQEHYGKKINLCERKQFNINDSPTEEEMRKYY